MTFGMAITPLRGYPKLILCFFAVSNANMTYVRTCEVGATLVTLAALDMDPDISMVTYLKKYATFVNVLVFL
jgi:hypothetical protein